MSLWVGLHCLLMASLQSNVTNLPDKLKSRLGLERKSTKKKDSMGIKAALGDSPLTSLPRYWPGRAGSKDSQSGCAEGSEDTRSMAGEGSEEGRGEGREKWREGEGRVMTSSQRRDLFSHLKQSELSHSLSSLSQSSNKALLQSAVEGDQCFQMDLLLKEGRDLVIRDSRGTSDPYVDFKIGSKRVYRSRSVSKNLNPKWNEHFTVTIDDLSEPIRVKVKDKDSFFSKDDPMGSSIILPSRLQLDTPMELNLYLHDHKPDTQQSDYMGYIIVQCTLYSRQCAEEESYFRKITRASERPGGVGEVGSGGGSKKIKAPPQQMWQAVVTVVLVSGRDLLPMDDNGLSDPYVRFKLGTEKYKSKYKPKTLTPRWLEQFDLYLFSDQSSHMELSVFDRDVGGRDEFMGRAELDVGSLEREVTHSLELTLEDCAGSICLLVTVTGQALNSPHPSASSLMQAVTVPDQSVVRRYNALRSFKDISDIGCLKVRVIRAQNLMAADLGGTSDPFVVLELVNTRLQTHTEYKTLSPEWGKTFSLKVLDIHSVLDIVVYDSNKDKKSEFLGRIAIPLLKIRQNEVRTYQLKDRNLLQRVKGSIQLQMSVVYNPVRAAIRTVNPREEKYMVAEPKFKISIMKRNIDRVSRIVNAVRETGRFVQSCFLWESTIRSASAFFVFLVVVWYIELYMVPVSLVLLFLKNLLVEHIVGLTRKEPAEDVMSIDDDDDDEDKDSKDEKKNQSFRERLASIQGVLLNVQEGMDMVASLGERIKNTFRWSVPWLSTLAVLTLTVATLLLYYIPLRFIVLAWGLNKFTKKLRKPDAIDNNELLDFLSRVPTDKEIVQYSELRIEEPSPATGPKKRRRLESKSSQQPSS